MNHYIIFVNPQAYCEIVRIDIEADEADVRNDWLCFWRGESLIASFDLATIHGWFLDRSANIPDQGSEQQTTQTGCSWADLDLNGN
jgi:hypothetical protein